MNPNIPKLCPPKRQGLIWGAIRNLSYRWRSLCSARKFLFIGTRWLGWNRVVLTRIILNWMCALFAIITSFSLSLVQWVITLKSLKIFTFPSAQLLFTGFLIAYLNFYLVTYLDKAFEIFLCLRMKCYLTQVCIHCEK